VTKAAAVHIGADVLDSPEHARWARPRFCQVTVDRLSQLCRSADIVSQHRIVGAEATVDRVRESVVGSAIAVGPGGLLVLSFSGHSQRAVPGEKEGGWCLRDGVLLHRETGRLLAAADPSAQVIVIADTCYATAFAAAFESVRATTVLLAACGENQATLDYPVSFFVAALERLTFPDGTANPACRSYAWLRRELRKDTPDVERPDVCANRPGALRRRPFRGPRASARPV
jgi:hypothetical protein